MSINVLAALQQALSRAIHGLFAGHQDRPEQGAGDSEEDHLQTQCLASHIDDMCDCV